jgi:hypothetical protein
MYQPMMYNWQRPADTLSINIFPSGKSSYTLYEDDGLTRDYRKGSYATTEFSVDATSDGTGLMEVRIDAAKGDFKGRLLTRKYLLEVHSGKAPGKVMINGKKIKAFKGTEKYNSNSSGWYYDPETFKGTLHIKTNQLSTNTQNNIIISQR